MQLTLNLHIEQIEQVCKLRKLERP
ncbi:hypothetical protein Pint_04921 [Pistacia integerrima]|uniref:Uncharacterized protein n=1 Tax=Pistacia integerrima TaxID=434235 RepID=A0ACC0Z6G3_9ROSI|nr:hypothetical protein Pint_04921 [Pistacia integerrima]